MHSCLRCSWPVSFSAGVTVEEGYIEKKLKEQASFFHISEDDKQVSLQNPLFYKPAY